MIHRSNVLIQMMRTSLIRLRRIILVEEVAILMSLKKRKLHQGQIEVMTQKMS